jgi:hypothetical protein
MDIKPDPEVERVARALADFLGYSWDDLFPHSVVEKGYPLFAHNQVRGTKFQGGQQDLLDLARKLLYPMLRHSDDMAVDSFAGHMKQKLAAKRLDGRHGWSNKDLLHGGISGDELSVQLRRHVEKGDPLDVANFCMMLYHRGEPITGRAPYETQEAAAARLTSAKADLLEQQVAANERMSDDLKVERLLEDVVVELTKARAKFPGKNVTFAALVEEVGELATATFEESSDRVRKEAVQVAVMAMRVVLDGDHTFDEWRASHGLDPLVEQAVDQDDGDHSRDDRIL